MLVLGCQVRCGVPAADVIVRTWRGGTLVKIVLYVVWALFVVAVVWALCRTIKDMRRRETLMADWPKVLATVTGSRHGWTTGVGNSSRNRRFWPYYQFSDARGDVFRGESDISTAVETEPGSPLAVAYNPADPSESYQMVTQSKVVGGCLIPAFAFFAAGSLWFIGIFPVG
ncbi:hypothetical protein ARUE_c08090 [Arthrobacter sp. Rue61a]|nr:hypothetical protein ARUE_c08090 [Arthrobacter sp. Rue61a]